LQRQLEAKKPVQETVEIQKWVLGMGSNYETEK
jgi:hypothetical protein